MFVRWWGSWSGSASSCWSHLRSFCWPHPASCAVSASRAEGWRRRRRRGRMTSASKSPPHRSSSFSHPSGSGRLMKPKEISKVKKNKLWSFFYDSRDLKPRQCDGGSVNMRRKNGTSRWGDDSGCVIFPGRGFYAFSHTSRSATFSPIHLHVPNVVMPNQRC